MHEVQYNQLYSKVHPKIKNEGRRLLFLYHPAMFEKERASLAVVLVEEWQAGEGKGSFNIGRRKIEK